MVSPVKVYRTDNIHELEQRGLLDRDAGFAIRVVGSVFPFRTNSYVVEELIDWTNIPADPIYQLHFPQRPMLCDTDFDKVAASIRRAADRHEIEEIANSIRVHLNPHPGEQMTKNVPLLGGDHVPGVQHKYRETCLIFPSSGQVCHAYCTYCFRWPQFVGKNEFKFRTDESRRFADYIRLNKEITDVLVTGGDPLIMSTKLLASYIEPFLGPGFEHIQTIRIGTKSVAHWPYRFVTDKDADDLLYLFERVIAAGKHLAIMAHYTHWRELATDIAQQAILRIRSTGAVIRTQSPVVRHINDSPDVWEQMWHEQVRLGCVPYYMFVTRPTGPYDYFKMPLARALEVFSAAYRRMSGLGRTVRGPVMSASIGKVVIEGTASVAGKQVFVLSLLQARDPELCRRPFFASFDPDATWFEQLKPAFGDDTFFPGGAGLAHEAATLIRPIGGPPAHHAGVILYDPL
jgi:L-lysine 2,3-aminomutase